MQTHANWIRSHQGSKLASCTSGTQNGGNGTAPISDLITVSRPTVIQLQAVRVDAVGTAVVAQIVSDGVGYTSLRFVRTG